MLEVASPVRQGPNWRPLRDHSVTELRTIIDAERLRVKKNTGGLDRRTRLDIIRDISREFLSRTESPLMQRSEPPPLIGYSHGGQSTRAQGEQRRETEAAVAELAAARAEAATAARRNAALVQQLEAARAEAAATVARAASARAEHGTSTAEPHTSSPRPARAVRGTPPHSFVCPISMETFRDPVVTADGETYERACIQRHLDGGRMTSPLTNARLKSRALVPNTAMRRAIQEWRDQRESVDVATVTTSEVELA